MQVITSTDPPTQVIKKFLIAEKNSEYFQKDITLAYWLVNLMSLTSENSKKSLENVLEPEREITKD